MSALGWVARTVLTSGSRTGFIVVPRWAPSRASLRRTHTVDDVPGWVGGAGRAALRLSASGAGGGDWSRGGALGRVSWSRSWPGGNAPAGTSAAGAGGSGRTGLVWVDTVSLRIGHPPAAESARPPPRRMIGLGRDDGTWLSPFQAPFLKWRVW